MYENVEEEIQRILKLVDGCPETLRQTAFAILLQGFVDSLQPKPAVQAPVAPISNSTEPRPKPTQDWATGIPAEVLPRLRAMAKRRHITDEQLASQFDYTSDPFSFAPLNIPGSAANDRTKKAALLVAARAFLATGRWVGDWAEIKAMCTHQNCYDGPNFSATLKKAKGDIFKSVDVGVNVELSATGTEQAETLLAELAGTGNASAE